LPDFSGILKSVLVGILGALLLVSALSSWDITVRALDFTLSLGLDWGYTELAIPPLGTVRAKTHQAPLKFGISLKDINLERLKTMIAQGSDGIYTELVASLRSQIRLFIARILSLALLGGLFSGYILFRRPKQALLAGLAGLFVFALMIGAALLTYNEQAFREPEYKGVVEAAPWLLGVADNALAEVEKLEDKLKIIAVNLTRMFESLSQVGTEELLFGSELKILHVSDIHNNPLGVSLALQMAEAFKADIIIDTGDATDYGTPIEGELVRNISASKPPWVFVPGNHDSPAVVQVLRELENVTVLEAGLVSFEKFDLTIAGIADPAASGTGMRVPSKEEYKEAAARLQVIIDQAERKPSIIIAHHVYIVEEFSQWPVTLLHGHGHRVNIRTLGEAVAIDAGTAGGAGIRGLISTQQIPYTMVLLHMRRQGEGWQAIVADIITINQRNAGFILERKLLAEPIEIGAEDLEESPGG
jgi:predicted phosphodiesterase